MNVAAVIRKAGRRFGDSNNVLIAEQDYFDFINDAQIAICRVTGDVLTTNSNPAAATYPLTVPAAFIKGERCDYGGRPLDLIDKDDLDARKIDVTDFLGEPYFYYYYNNQIHLYPDPAVGDTTTVNFTYWSTPTEIISTGTALSVPVSHHEDVVTFVVARCHERNENWNMYGRLMDEFNQNLGLRTDESKIRDDTYTIIRDDPWDDYVL
jgi:hypothetical protein